MLSNFTNQYQLSKTLRFELKPVGDTLKHIETNGLIVQDETRSEEYQEVKAIIDKYHKAFIDEAFQDVVLSNLKEYEELFLRKIATKKLLKKYKPYYVKRSLQILRNTLNIKHSLKKSL